jgi:hypothetical protein
MLLVEPISPLKKPSEHPSHSVEASSFSNLPAGHNAHVEEPAKPANDPAVQLEHVKAPLADWYLPASHN